MLDGLAAPYAGCAVERDRKSATKTRFLFHREMTIEQNPLRARQPVARAIGMVPARLHEGKPEVTDERRHRAAEKVARRNEVRIEDRNEGCIGMGKAEGEIAGLEAAAMAT